MKFNFDPSVSPQNQALVNGWSTAIEAGFSGAGTNKPVKVTVQDAGTQREVIVLEIPDAFSNGTGRVQLLPTDSAAHVEDLCKREFGKVAQQNPVTKGANIP